MAVVAETEPEIQIAWLRLPDLRGVPSTWLREYRRRLDEDFGGEIRDGEFESWCSLDDLYKFCVRVFNVLTIA